MTPKEIAEGLSDAQRETLLGIHPDEFEGFRLDEGEGHANYTALCAANLLGKWRPAGMHMIYHVRPLGLEVRNYLLENPQ